MKFWHGWSAHGSLLLALIVFSMQVAAVHECQSGYNWDRRVIGCIQTNCEDVEHAFYNYGLNCVCYACGDRGCTGDEKFQKPCRRPADYAGCPGCLYSCIGPDDLCPGEQGPVKDDSGTQTTGSSDDAEPDVECTPEDPGQLGKQVGTVSYISGELEIKRQGEWFKAEEGDILEVGDSFRNGLEDLARIHFFDDPEDSGEEPWVVDLSGDTNSCVQDYIMSDDAGVPARGNTVVRILNGILHAVTKGWKQGSIFSVKAGTTICGIRGTDVVFSYQPETKETSVYVHEGTVEVNETVTGETRMLKAGQQIVIRDSKVSEIKPLSSEQWEMIVDKTEMPGGSDDPRSTSVPDGSRSKRVLDSTPNWLWVLAGGGMLAGGAFLIASGTLILIILFIIIKWRSRGKKSGEKTPPMEED
ncbi:hypothetical protein ACFLRF_03250 [Candidatus Altiarchaeota archaeon]